MKRDRDKLTEAVKQLAGQHEAALVGIAPVERFDPSGPLRDAAPFTRTLELSSSIFDSPSGNPLQPLLRNAREQRLWKQIVRSS